MNAIAKLAAEIRDITKDSDKKFRFNRQRLLEDEIANFRPDYNEAMELLDALVCGLKARFDDNLPVDLENDFSDIKLALSDADDIEFRRIYKSEDFS